MQVVTKNSVSETTLNDSQKNPRNEDHQWRQENMNWDQRLEEAKEWGCFLSSDVFAAMYGENDPLRERPEWIGREIESHHLREVAYEKRWEFYRCVKKGNIREAEKYLKEIQNMRCILKSDRISWEERMVLVEKFGTFTKDDVHHSQQWLKSPIAEKDSEFSGLASELTKEAYDTSLAFAKYVKESNVEEALKCFKQIQDMETILVPTWLERMHKAEKNRVFTDEDVQACRWFHTSPLYEKCWDKFVQITEEYCTKDARETTKAFEKYVTENNIQEAKKCLKEIQSHGKMDMLRVDDKSWSARVSERRADSRYSERYEKEARDWNQGPISERLEFKGRKVVKTELTDEAIANATAFADAIRDSNMMEIEIHLRTIQQMKVVLK